MKKLNVLLLLPLLLLLVACCAKPKDTFISRLKEINKQPAAQELTIKVDKLTIQGQANQVAPLEGAELAIEVHQDNKKKIAAITADLSQIPLYGASLSNLDMVYADGKMYMAADALAGIASLNGVTTDLSDLKGKYVDYSDSVMEATTDSKADLDYDYSWLEELDEKAFSEANGKVTATVTFKDIVKALPSSVTAQANISKQQLETYVSLFESMVSDDSKMLYTLDDKGNGDISLVLKSKSGAGLDFDMKLSLSTKKIAYKEPEVPAKSNILTQDEFVSLASSSATMTEEDFQEFYNQIEADMANTTQEDFQLMLDAVKPHLSDQQIQKLETLRSKAIAE